MDIWLCEYSPVQRAFHVDTLEKILADNRATVERGAVPGYIPIGVFLSAENARDFAEQWRQEHLKK